ncbi:hypothetical protein [Nostoc sp. CHAB 5715]|nr:hypothetical protein [Nostoc sp. CHAB 5715]
MNNLLTQVVTIGFGHMKVRSRFAGKGTGLLPVYAQTALAVAIT